jgi:uncharacterized protein YqeY
MSLKQQLESELKNAMRSADEDRKRTMRLILSGIKMTEIDSGKPADDQQVIAVLQKELKIRIEALEGAQQSGRGDLAELARREMTILNQFLPQQLSDTEIYAIVAQTASQQGFINPSDIGKLMKSVMPEVKGRATGDRVNRIVREYFEKLS